ncbi:MAG: Lrp/AsnC family transcriptional regulator [Clostridia bacterium]|nr:Lrp/AsnC family transcriptional regulator [Clostridia bacterium]
MDKLDFKVLSLLQKNARETASHIAESVSLSVSSVIERIKKLESTGVIEQYTVRINQEKIGMGLEALMEISLEHPMYYQTFTDFIKENKNVVACHYLTGEFDFLIRIYANDSDDLEQIHRAIKGFKGVSATNTHVVLKTVKNEYSYIPSTDE